MSLQSVGPTFDAGVFDYWSGVVLGSPYEGYLVVPPRQFSMGWAAASGTGSSSPSFIMSWMNNGMLPQVPYTPNVGVGNPPGGDSLGGFYEPVYGGGNPTWNTQSGSATLSSPSTYSVAALLDFYYYPGNIFIRWDYDVATGDLLQASTFGISLGSVFAAGSKSTQDPAGGATWVYNSSLDSAGGVFQLNPLTMTAGSQVIRPYKYTGSTAVQATGIFALDSAKGVLLADWANTGINGVATLYNYFTGQKIATISYPVSAGGALTAIMDGTNFIYIADSNRWIHVFDYTGKYYNSLLNDSFAPGVPVSYCYDPLYKCLRCAPFPLCNANGTSNMVPQAFYPVAAVERLTAPIPRKVPRLGSGNTLWSHVTGGGLEAKAGVFGVWSGSASGQVISDVNGDILLPYTPTATGSGTATVTVNT